MLTQTDLLRRDVRCAGWSCAEDTLQHCACGNGWRKCKLSTNAEGPLKPTLAMIAVSIRASEFYAIEGVVMRLLGEWTAETN